MILICLLIYRCFYFLIKFFLQLFQSLLFGKTKIWYQLRSNQDWKNISFKKSLWFHASSGEVEYCKAIINQIKQDAPETKIILSYSSPSAEKLFFNIKDQVDFIFPLPWDSPSVLQALISHVEPRAVIFSRTDFWPELITQLRKKNIPMMAVSMFPRFHGLSSFLFCWLLQDFSLITTVSEEKSFQLQKILRRPVETFSDTRFDQVFARLTQPSRIDFKTSALRIVFASTWPEDEKILLPTVDSLLQKGFQIIWAPHEISRAPELLQKLKQFKPQILSQLSNLQTPVMIVDQVGYLADIYRATQWAFVGGSFRRKIHSVMEPLAAGNIVFFGPHFQNNPEALTTHSQGLTFMVLSTEEVLKLVQPKASLELQKKAQIFAEKQRGSSRLIAQKILNQTHETKPT